MAVTITGSKYGDVALSAVGTTTATVGSATFVSGDFTAARRVQLHDSAGAKKGDAFVRRFVSTTQVELEDVFRNWKTGAAVTQAVGDIILISKNYAEIVTTGITFSNRVASISDELIWGTSSDPKSLCFHDEAVVVNFTINSGTLPKIQHAAGGTVTHGHLSSWVNKTTHSPVYTNYYNGSTLHNLLYFDSTSASFMYFGGMLFGSGYYGSGWDGGAALGTDAAFMWVLQTACEEIGFLSKNAGGDWTDGTNHVLEGCTCVGASDNLITLRWANGSVIGGAFKFLRGLDVPISMFGSDAAGTFPIGAPAGQRSVVQDMGVDNALWRASSDGITQTINATNLISTNFDCIYGPPGTPAQSGATLWQYFQSTYSNLNAASIGLVRQDAGPTLTDSIVGTGASWSPTVLYDKYIGKTHQTGYPLGPWSYCFKAYGFAPVSGAIAESNYDLGTAGTAKNVGFGGAVIQTADASVTLSQAAALALTTLPTLDNVYDRTIAWSVTDATNAQYPTLGAYMVSAMGSSLDFGSRNIVVDATAGSAFAVNTGTNTVTIKATTLSAGAKFTKLVTSGTISFVNGAAPSATLPYQSSAGTSVPVTAPSIVSGSRVQIYDVTNSVDLDNVVIGGGGYVGRFTWTTNKTIRLRAMYCSGVTAKLPVTSIATLTNTGASFLDTQVDDQVYIDAGINGSSVTEFAGDYPNVQIDVTDPDGVTTVPRIYAWFVNNLMTSSGIALFFGGLTADDGANFIINTPIINLKLDNTNVAPVIIGGGRLYHDDGSTVIAAASNSIQMDPNRVYTVETGTSGLTGPEAALLADIAPIKAKTDSLAFTVAGHVNANVQYVNDVQIAGTGVPGDTWGPA